jgi:hypothetical protein
MHNNQQIRLRNEIENKRKLVIKEQEEKLNMSLKRLDDEIQMKDEMETKNLELKSKIVMTS